VLLSFDWARSWLRRVECRPDNILNCSNYPALAVMTARHHRDGESSAALNWILARKSAGLAEAVRAVGGLVLPASRRPNVINYIVTGGTEGFLQSRPFASVVGRAKRVQASSSGKQGFFQGFFTPPSCSNLDLASISSTKWQLRVASKIAGIIMMKNGELAVDASLVRGETSHGLDEAQVRGMFDEMDVNGNGFIDRDELLNLLQGLGLPANNSSYLR
jgi:hypothetical protein